MRRSIRLTISVISLMALFILGASFAYAEGDAALTVQKDGKTVKIFTMDELQVLAEKEGNKTYNYSSWNIYPSFDKHLNIEGPSVESVLADAKVLTSVTDTNTVNFWGDGYDVNLTGKQLFGETRYYYPNVNLVDHENGYIPEDSYEGREIMPAVISLDGDTVLCVGQVAPNEENTPLFVKKIAKGGVINISTKTAARCSKIVSEEKSCSLQKENTRITLKKGADSNINWDYDKIYYTFDDRTSPSYGCAIYNCGPKQGMVCNPVCIPGNDPKKTALENKTITLKVRVKGYGKQDSVVQSFTYYVGKALTVKVNGITKKEYDSEEDVINSCESGTYSYSGFNSYPTQSSLTNITGVKVSSIIADATGFIPGTTLNNNALISFTGTDGKSTTMTIGQLFTDRYYYPNASKGTNTTGGAVKAAAYEGKKITTAVIETNREDSESKNTFLFGQVEPNEQNTSECIKGMLKLGEIEIKTNGDLNKCRSITESDPENGSEITQGQAIKFLNPSKPDDEDKPQGDPLNPYIDVNDPDKYVDDPEIEGDEHYTVVRDKICYVIDPENGTEPGLANGFYNYSAFRSEEKLTNPPILNDPGTHTIKVKVIGYGKLDGDVTDFTYKVVPKKPASFTVSTKTYNSVSLKWTANTKATGYKIYRSSGSGYSLIKTITSAATTSYKNTSLKTGTAYKYLIKAYYEDSDGEILLSDYRVTSATPSLSKPSVTVTAGARKATVKWKKIAGASGYEVYRSIKKSSGFKKVKTAGSSTVSYTNKSLKKGKVYYYKIRAYRTVSGKKVYSSYSTVKYVKVK